MNYFPFPYIRIRLFRIIRTQNNTTQKPFYNSTPPVKEFACLLMCVEII